MKNIRSLSDLRKQLDKIPFINNGGCAISALVMYRWLKKNKKLTKNTKFIYLYRWTCNFNHNLEASKNKKIRPTCACHVALIHRGKILDSEGVVNRNHYEYFQIVEDEKFVLRSINNIIAWNHSFKRKNGIKMIKENVNVKISDIKYHK